MVELWDYARLTQEAAERGGPACLRRFYTDQGHKAGSDLALEAGVRLGLKEGMARGLKTGMARGRAQGLGAAGALVGAYCAATLVSTYGPPLLAVARERYGRPRPAAPETTAPASEETALDTTPHGRTTTLEGDR